MPRFQVLNVLVRRVSGRGALDNVSEVLMARADAAAAIEAFEVRVCARAPIAA